MSEGGREVVLGVSGGIAAYKAAELLRLFTESGHGVTVVPTAAALRFVGAATWEALSSRPVSDDVFSDVDTVRHVRLGRDADLVVVAPATADLLARAASGRADDLLTSTLLTTRCPVLFAPAMHTEMWEHPATVENVAALRGRGNVVAEPASGRLTGADTGRGRLPEPAEIFWLAKRLLSRGRLAPDLSGRRIVVNAGGTREPLDPVRFIGNRSSGKQGFALARAAAARGASVCVVAANVDLPDPAGVEVRRVETTGQLRDTTVEAAAEADAVILSAAPADFRPDEYSDVKLKKWPDSAMQLRLIPNPDIAAELGADPVPGRVLAVFAAETHNGLEHAVTKLAAKRADLAVLNEVGDGRAFGTDDNTVTFVWPQGGHRELPTASKDDLADAILDEVARLWKEQAGE